MELLLALYPSSFAPLALEPSLLVGVSLIFHSGNATAIFEHVQCRFCPSEEEKKCQ